MPMQAGWMGIEPPPTPEPSHWLEAGELILIGVGKLEVRLTPGHSPGSVSFVAPGFVISGDALFAGSVGRTDIPGASHSQLIEGIRAQLLTLPDETVVYPGHAKETTIGIERQSNPFLHE